MTIYDWLTVIDESSIDFELARFGSLCFRNHFPALKQNNKEI